MRLLLVEDDVMLASGIKLGLCGAGYAVDWVGSGERALDALKAGSFDAAIVDLGLPKMDGLELIKLMRTSGYSLPILILTARDALQDRVQGLDYGADDYMVKPFELPLHAILQRIACGKNQNRQAVAAAAHQFGQLQAIHLWQTQVNDGRIKAVCFERIKRALTRAHPIHCITRATQPQLDPAG